MKKIFSLLLGLMLFSFLVAPMMSVDANNDKKPEDKYGLINTAQEAGLYKKDVSVPATIGKIIGVALSLIGVVFFALMLYGGYLWMTAKGDASKAERAQQIIVDAIIGLVVVGAAYIITKLVFEAIE